MRVGLKHKTLN